MAPTVSTTTPSDDEQAIRALHAQLLNAWNDRDAKAFASLVLDQGHLVGFDGSEMDGPAEIEATLAAIFSDHATSAYVAIVRRVWLPSPDVGILEAVVGMVPPGQSELKADVNAVQTLVAARTDGSWRIALLQNTPAAYHGRAEERARLTAELRQAMHAGNSV